MCYCVPFCVTVYTLQVRGSGRLMVTKHALEDSGRSQMVDQLRRAGLYTWTPMERYLRLYGWVVGMPAVHVEQDVGVFRQVMQHSAVKGSNGLEGRVGKEAWLPSLSVESEDGEVWQRLRRCFDAHLSTTSWRQRLPAIVEDVCRNASEGVVDSTAIAACVVRIQWRLLFRQDCQGPDLELMLAARDEWAKTLSLRGPPDPDVRERAFRLVATKVGATFVNTDPDLSTVEFVSTFFQPWLLSPAINVPDLFASLPGFRKKHPEYDTASPHLLVALLDYEHPFPLLERELTRDLGSRRAGDHVFHLQGLGVRGVGSTGIRFGSGDRACPGASVASTLFHHLVLGLQDAADFRPTVNHRWSGRTNDAKGSWFQLGQMARLLFFRWGPTDNVDEWRARYANPDRLRKYGYGSLRLAAFLWFVSAGSPTNTVKFLLVAFLTGMVGALVNVELLYRRMATALLAAVATAWLALPFEQLFLCGVYLVKTMTGDYFARKLDTPEWRLVGGFSVALCLATTGHGLAVRPAFFLLLVLHQFLMEFADGRLEDNVVFRHRYGFEAFYALMIGFWPSTPLERGVVTVDLVACLGYRVANALLCVVVALGSGDSVHTWPQKCLLGLESRTLPSSKRQG